MVADIIQSARKPVHVVAVERRHESAVEEIDQLVGEPVALVLQLLHLAFEIIRAVREAVE